MQTRKIQCEATTEVANNNAPAKSRQPEFDAGLVELSPNLRAFACSLTRDTRAADDLVQDTLARAMTYHEKFHPGTNLRAWLFRMMRNLFLAGKRRDQVYRAIVPQLEARSVSVSKNEQIDHLELAEVTRAVQKLPPEQRRAINLVGRIGLSYKEAAKLEGCAVGTVKSRVSRARATLSKE